MLGISGFRPNELSNNEITARAFMLAITLLLTCLPLGALALNAALKIPPGKPTWSVTVGALGGVLAGLVLGVALTFAIMFGLFHEI